jgi:VWFA-related protein
MRTLTTSLAYLLLASLSALYGQTPAASTAEKPDSTTTFKTTARFVIVDALVTDKSGRPVHGLKPQDLVVTEDGKPQRIVGFEEHRPDIASTHPPLSVSLPPDTYTNYISADTPGATNLILFDSLNTDRQSLTMARQQLVLYLSKMPPKTRVALFTLDSELHLVHGLTEDPGQLIELAQQLSTSPHQSFTKARDLSESLARLKESGITISPTTYRNMVRFLYGEQEGKEEIRTLVTMQALEELARSVAVIPGRKNLIWISGGIPFDPTTTAPQMHQLANLLTATQVAVYPIDVRGVAYLGADGAALSSEVFAPRGGSYETSSGQSQELLSVHESMTSIATMTGGKMYANRNDLHAVIGESIDSGSNYYNIVYRPQNNNWDGKFRKISIKTLQPNLKVQSRPGYYAVSSPLSTPGVDESFNVAMQPNVPNSTTLIFKARVRPTASPDKKTQFDFLVDIHDLSLNQTADGLSQPDVLFVAAVRDDKGRPVKSDASSYRQPLKAPDLQSLTRTGLQLHREIDLDPGTYTVRLGVVDRLSGKIGTLDVPLKVDASTN